MFRNSTTKHLLTIFTSLTFGLIFAANAREISPKNQTKILPQITVVASDEGKNQGYKITSSRSSTRTNTALIDTPQSISVVSQEQIRDQNITKMEEAARYVPGVNMQMGEGHRDQVIIRGMTNGSNGTTSNFFIDGARDDAEYIRDFYNIEQIEFLKGPNAMAFGRGSPGGVINRVSKTADGKTTRRLILSGGSFDDRRAEADLGGRVNDKFALRLNSMYQKSNSYRRYVGFERYGFNPTATINLSDDTKLEVGYEHFNDDRIIDRGIPSQNGAPYKTSSAAFFGNPDQNQSRTQINSVYGIITHDFDKSLQLRNYTRVTNNHKFYQNIVPGTISGNNLSLSAYNAQTNRDNFTNQTDITKKFETGKISHTALLGAEITSQNSTKVRANATMGSSTVSLSDQITNTSVLYNTIAQDNKSNVRVFAGYLQDQIKLNEHLELTAGLRLDRFEVQLKDRKNNLDFERIDTMLSPRAGLVIKPEKSLSLYTSYGVTYLPSAGDQLDSLSVKTSILKPEKLQNYELGAKWDVNPKFNLSAAIFQLDRTNTPASDPSGSGYFVLTGESRTRGLEFAATGKITDKWQTIASYAFQDAQITSPTSTSGTSTTYAKGAKVALVPHNTFSLWNKYDFTSKLAAGLGAVSQSDQFAGSDNSVRLKGFTRFDGALYYRFNPSHRLQLNVENIFNRGYIQTAHSNSNILSGSPRAFKVSLIADF